MLVFTFYPDQPKREFISPNGSLKATVVVRAGGGGFAPYCNVLVYVQPSTEMSPRSEFTVFEGDCVTIQDFDTKVTWLADDRLRSASRPSLAT